MIRRLISLLAILLLACGGQQAAGVAPADTTQEVAPAPADGALTPRRITPVQFRDAGIDAPRAQLFTPESFESDTFWTVTMGATVVRPEFEREHVVGVVVPSAPTGSSVSVEGLTFADGVLTLRVTHHRTDSGDFNIQPNLVVGVPKVEGATSLVVQVNGETIATFSL